MNLRIEPYGRMLPQYSTAQAAVLFQGTETYKSISEVNNAKGFNRTTRQHTSSTPRYHSPSSPAKDRIATSMCRHLMAAFSKRKPNFRARLAHTQPGLASHSCSGSEPTGVLSKCCTRASSFALVLGANRWPVCQSLSVNHCQGESESITLGLVRRTTSQSSPAESLLAVGRRTGLPLYLLDP